MRRFCCAMLLAALAAGCGGEPPAPEAPPEAPAAPEAPPEDVMENVQLELWPSTDTPGQDVKPLLLIRAARVTGSNGETKSLSFEGAEATVPAAAPGATELQFTAQHGAFEEGVRAVLDQGVVARVNDMIIELESITWEVGNGSGEAGSAANEGGGGFAYSDRPLKITSPTQRLEAASLRLDVATETIELRQVTGEITFSGETP